MAINIQAKTFRKEIATKVDWTILSYGRNAENVEVAVVFTNEENAVVYTESVNFGVAVTTAWGEDNSAIDTAVLNYFEATIL